MVSIKITVMAVTLVTLCILATNTHAAYRFCCRRYTPVRIPFSGIMSFSMQRKTELCPVSAIIFLTKTHKICGDPSQQWVMDYVNVIEKIALKTQTAVQGPDRIASDYVKQRDYITEKVRQEAEPQPEDGLDKINEDGPLPMTLCKW